MRQPTEGKKATDFDKATEMYLRIFGAGIIEEGVSVENENKRFVYYTSADTAMTLLRNRELWFRNANVMNEFSEIAYGLNLIEKVFSEVPLEP